MFNEKTRKITLDILGKLEGLAKKHGVKIIGWWNVTSEHLVYGVFDAPSLEAFQKFGMEPEILALGSSSTSEYKMAIGPEEVAKILKQAK